jgi:hypothetical protein
MKKSTTLLSLLEHLISNEDIQTLLDRHKYKDTAREFTVSMLLRFLVMAAANEWKAFRHGADVSQAYDLQVFHYSTFSKKASDVPYLIIKDLLELILSRCNRRMRRSVRFPKELLLIDSTTITVGETRLPWAPYHGKRAGIKLHVGLFEATRMPKKVVETTGLKHDSPMMDAFLDRRFILVADRAYFQLKRIDSFLETEQPFVIRMKMNVELPRKKSLRRFITSDSNVINDFTCQLGTPQNRTAYRHRVIEFTDYEGHVMRVVTNLRDVSAEIVAQVYQARWAIEVFFRWIKQHLNVPTLFGTTENAVFNQLFAALLTYVLLKAFYEEAKKYNRLKNVSFISFTRQLIEGQLLSVEWQIVFQDFIKNHQAVHNNDIPKTG